MGCESSKGNIQSTSMPIVVNSKQNVTEQSDYDFAVVVKQNFDQVALSYPYTKVFKDIVVNMKFYDYVVKDFTNYSREMNSRSESNHIDEFEHNYRAKSPIWWYTRQCFVNKMLTQAIRSLEINTLFRMSFFIHDLHHQIEQLYKQQAHEKPFIVYHAQYVVHETFQNLLKSIGQVMCFNDFLLANEIFEDSIKTLTKPNTAGVLFQISVNPAIKTVPFASIQETSYSQKQGQVLFAMHSMFRIDGMEMLSDNPLHYQIELKLISNDDPQIRQLDKSIEENVSHVVEWQRLGEILFKLSQFDKAEELYRLLLEQAFSNNQLALYYNQLGYVKDNQEDYENALIYYVKSLEMWQKITPTNKQELAITYGNIGRLYCNLEDYPKAFLFNEKSLEIRKDILASDHPELASSYNNIGMVYQRTGDYRKALEYFEKALEIWQKSPPSNYPMLATSYSNIGSTYENLGDFTKAYSFFQKGLDIKKKTLPANHPDLAISYDNIGLLYQKMGEYSKALSSLNRAVEIYQKSLSADSSLLATTYNNIGLTYQKLNDFSKALSFHQKALEIRKQILPADHPALKATQDNIDNCKKRL
ncbi:unnamed protein product [Adineta ricciae]|uniref:Tetratricopeptide repeat protein n=2 Tax=Adineta ricciae TaxID=249248 RepID=A0A814VHP9_ADIRI|nr:unnamed protein product [Adineta ricciae]